MTDDSANKMEADSIHNEQQNNEKDGINLLAVYRIMLRIVAKLEKSEYADKQLFEHQTEVYQHSDLANPASETDTPPG